MAEAIYGLIGRRLGHSWSVLLHKALGCGDYRLIELEPEAVGPFLRGSHIGGLNVTIPYKKAVLPYLDRLDGPAAAIGSVNTITSDGQGRLWGHNTDAAGFAYLVRRAGVDLGGKKLVIFGDGGAQPAVAYAAKALGAGEIAVISRRGEDTYEHLDRHQDGQVLVNTTPVGMYPDMDGRIVDLRAFPRCEAVLDIVFNPLRTELMRQAAALGIPCAGGLGMLAAQAVFAERLFAGMPGMLSAQAVEAESLFAGQALSDGEAERLTRLAAREKENIVLIGMPGSGKSTVGRLLAAQTGRPLLDTDELITRRAGRSIPEIFTQEGEGGFRARERAAVAEAELAVGSILVTGGGAVLSPENEGPLRRNGRVYQLERALDALPREGRPLSQGVDLAAMYRQREPLYRRFRDAAAVNAGPPEETADWIWRDFCEHSGD